MAVIVWFDGAVMPLEAARLSPLDRGVTVGDGVFETLRVYDGTPFAWRRHHERLVHSAEALGLQAPTSDTLRSAAAAVLAANELRDARLRITVTGGEGPPGSSRAGAIPHAWVVAWPFAPSAVAADVVIAPWTRNERSATAGLKTISYAANVRALAYAEARGASEAIFANTSGHLCEATGSNVFCVHDSVVRTPPPSAGCLLGVTRGLLLELAASLGLACEESDLPIGALATADEAFLSSTTREAQSIAHVDGVALATAPGPVTVELAAAFRGLVARDLDP
jgi:branched-chain amino acid aminotransferase